MPKIIVTEENIASIIYLIHTWRGKLTWDLLCNQVSSKLGTVNVTRQTLSGYKEIQHAYTQKKETLRAGIQPPVRSNTNTEYLLNQIESLEAELLIANRTIDSYKERFVRWQYNAYIHGIRIDSLDDALEVLDKPLHDINRRG